MVLAAMLGLGAYAVSFGAGVSSFLAPCVIPLMPAYVAYVCGAPVAALAEDKERFQRTLMRGSLFYVIGFALIFVPLGLAASTLGMALRDNQAAVARAGGALVILFGLQQLGVLRALREKLGWQPLPLIPRISKAPEGGGMLRPVALGMVFGLAWTPCVGPILGAVLVIAAQTGSAAEGAGLLAVYALGVGIPFVALALLFVNFPSVLQPIARRARLITRFAGVAMLALGLLMVLGLYTELTSFLARFAPSVGAV